MRWTAYKANEERKLIEQINEIDKELLAQPDKDDVLPISYSNSFITPMSEYMKAKTPLELVYNFIGYYIPKILKYTKEYALINGCTNPQISQEDIFVFIFIYIYSVFFYIFCILSLIWIRRYLEGTIRRV